MFSQQQEHWFEALENLALYGLNNEFDFNHFEQQLENTPVNLIKNGATPLPEGERRIGWHSEGMVGRDVVAGVASQHIHQQLLASMKGYSLWWTVGSDTVDPAFIVYQGLPPVEDFASLISGEW